MIKTSLAVAAFLTQALPAMAYPLVDAACKDNVVACIKAGKLEYVSIYGKLGYEVLGGPSKDTPEKSARKTRAKKSS
jgi:hypothetical protein